MLCFWNTSLEGNDRYFSPNIQLPSIEAFPSDKPPDVQQVACYFCGSFCIEKKEGLSCDWDCAAVEAVDPLVILFPIAITCTVTY